MGRSDGGGDVLRLRAERLRSAVGKVGAKRAAAGAGVPYTTVRDAMSGGDMRLSTAAALARVCGVTVDWIANGGGDGVQPVDPPDGPPGGVVDGRSAAAGEPGPIGLDWLAGHLALPVAELVVFPVLGDAMEPTVRDGDVLVARRSGSAVVVPGIYAIEVDGSVIARRLEPRVDGTLVVGTDNARYAPQVVRSGPSLPFRVIGPIVWLSGVIRN